MKRVGASGVFREALELVLFRVETHSSAVGCGHLLRLPSDELKVISLRIRFGVGHHQHRSRLRALRRTLRDGGEHGGTWRGRNRLPFDEVGPVSCGKSAEWHP